MSWEPQTPVEFAVFFVAAWVAASFALALFGGWKALADDYRLEGDFEGQKWYMRSASFRYLVHYGGVLTIGANGRGLYLSILLPLRLGHPPLLIPWEHVRKAERSFFSFFNTALQLGHDSPVRVSLSSRLVRDVEGVLGHELPTERPGR